MAILSLDDKIKYTIDRISFLIKQIPIVTADGQIAAHAYNVAMNNNDSVGADINRNANIAANGKLADFKAELATLATPGTGILATLQAQKNVQINAQQAIVNSALTPQQKAALALEKIKAEKEIALEESKKTKSNTTTYAIIAVVIIVIVVAAVYFKIKK